MAKLPKQVKVSGHIIRVQGGVDKGFGYYERDNGTINISTDKCHDQQATALLHEILHVCFAESGLGVRYKDKEEEEIVRRLEPFLFQVLRDNPKVVEFILGRA